MKRNLVLVVALLAFAIVSTGCVAGPWTARETVDDWAAGVYSDDPVVGTVAYVFAWPLGTFGGSIIDAVVLNNIAWWGDDIWRGKGSTVNHDDAPNGVNNNPEGPAVTDL